MVIKRIGEGWNGLEMSLVGYDFKFYNTVIPEIDIINFLIGRIVMDGNIVKWKEICL